MENPIYIILLAIGNPVKTDSQIFFSNAIVEKEQYLDFFHPHIPSTSFGGIPSLHHTINMQKNNKEILEDIYVVDFMVEVV